MTREAVIDPRTVETADRVEGEQTAEPAQPSDEADQSGSSDAEPVPDLDAGPDHVDSPPSR
jgi:hypothetical protein